MNTNQLRKATVMTIALLVERLFNAVSKSNDQDAARQLILIERGASLLLSSIVNDGNVDDDFIQSVRDELAEALDDDSVDDILPDVLSIELPSPPNDPRLN